MKLKVGDRVECTWFKGWVLSWDIMPYGLIAQVVSASVNGVTVRFEDDDVERKFRPQQYNWGHDYWKLAPPMFTASKPVCHRDGRPAIVELTDDPVRPYRATLGVCGRTVTLSFDPYGRFYSGFEQPIDLANP